MACRKAVVSVILSFGASQPGSRAEALLNPVRASS